MSLCMVLGTRADLTSKTWCKQLVSVRNSCLPGIAVVYMMLRLIRRNVYFCD